MVAVKRVIDYAVKIRVKGDKVPSLILSLSLSLLTATHMQTRTLLCVCMWSCSCGGSLSLWKVICWYFIWQEQCFNLLPCCYFFEVILVWCSIYVVIISIFRLNCFNMNLMSGWLSGASRWMHMDMIVIPRTSSHWRLLPWMCAEWGWNHKCEDGHESFLWNCTWGSFTVAWSRACKRSIGREHGRTAL